jgi:hypothetical protein
MKSGHTQPDKNVDKTSSRPVSSSGRDASTPPSLSEEEAKEYASAVTIFSERTVACVLSPYFNLREAGLKQVTDFLLKSSENGNVEETLKAAFQIVSFVSHDIREKSNVLFVSLFEAAIGWQF